MALTIMPDLINFLLTLFAQGENIKRNIMAVTRSIKQAEIALNAISNEIESTQPNLSI